MAEWIERRITESASLTNMNTMLTSGSLSGNVRFLHLKRKLKKQKCKLLEVTMSTQTFSEKSIPRQKNDFCKRWSEGPHKLFRALTGKNQMNYYLKKESLETTSWNSLCSQGREWAHFSTKTLKKLFANSFFFFFCKLLFNCSSQQQFCHDIFFLDSIDRIKPSLPFWKAYY